MGNTFGHTFRLTTWGESHGAGIGVVVDGCPPRLPLTADDLQADLDRRRPGQSRLTTQRDEADRAEILSGVFEGLTTGGPIAVLVRNDDARPGAYDHLRDLYRPSHADFTYEAKYGHRDWRGGGRSSARETIGRVAAGAIARRLLTEVAGIQVLAWVSRVHDITADVAPDAVTVGDVEADPTRYCALDGRSGDLGSKTPAHLIPLVSDKWSSHFKWRGRDPMPAGERAKLEGFVARARKDGRLLRFWAVPDQHEAWQVLHDTGVDLINTDKLKELARFLRSQ